VRPNDRSRNTDQRNLLLATAMSMSAKPGRNSVVTPTARRQLYRRVRFVARSSVAGRRSTSVTVGPLHRRSPRLVMTQVEVVS
jgi:hypothetical protein